MFAVVAIFACSSDDNSGPNDGGGNEDIFITFKVNGTTYEMEPFTGTSLKVEIGADQGLDESYTSISLLMPTDFTTGTHQITDASASDLEAYTGNYINGETSVDAASGTLMITSITDEFIEGTFNFVGDSNGITYNITEGSFRAER